MTNEEAAELMVYAGVEHADWRDTKGKFVSRRWCNAIGDYVSAHGNTALEAAQNSLAKYNEAEASQGN